MKNNKLFLKWTYLGYTAIAIVLCVLFVMAYGHSKRENYHIPSSIKPAIKKVKKDDLNKGKTMISIITNLPARENENTRSLGTSNSHLKEQEEFIALVNRRLKLEYDLDYPNGISGSMTKAMLNVFSASGNTPMGKAYFDVEMAIQQSNAPIIKGDISGEKEPPEQKKTSKIISSMFSIANTFSIEKGMDRGDEYREVYSILISELWRDGLKMKFFKRFSELLSQYGLQIPKHASYSFEEIVHLDD